MNKKLISLVLLLSVLKAGVLSADIDYWPMFKYDTRRTGQSPYPGPECCNEKWKFSGANYFYSSPSVRVEGNDTLIYIGNRGNAGVGLVYAIKDFGLNSVAKKWEYSAPACLEFNSSPLIYDKYIYIGEGTSAWDGKFYCLYSDSGKVRWTIPSSGFGFHGSSSSPVINAGIIYVGTYDGLLYAMKSNGNLRWTFSIGSVIQSSPAIASDGTIYIGADDNKLYAIEDSITYGKCKWTYQAGGKIRSSPAIGDDGTIYFSTLEDQTLYALNPDSTLKWTYSLSSRSANNRDRSALISSPAISYDGTIYIGAVADTVHAVNPDSTRKWAKYLPGGDAYWNIASSPALSSNGYVYIGVASDNWVPGTGGLFILKQSDGDIVCFYRTENEVWNSPAIGPNKTVYFGDCSGNKLYAIYCEDTGIEEKERVEGIEILGNYPNPFIAKTLIEYEIGKPTVVSMRIYNLSGRLVKVLVDEIQESGIHKISWDGTDDSGKSLPRGIYYCTTQCDEKNVTKKLILAR